MRPGFYALFSLLIILCGQSGCEGPAPARRSASQTAVLDLDSRPCISGLAAEQIRLAKDLYTAKCARCHKFYDPAGYNDRDWQSWLAKMSKKARLTVEQEQLLSRYLAGFRTDTTNDGAGQNQKP